MQFTLQLDPLTGRTVCVGLVSESFGDERILCHLSKMALEGNGEMIVVSRRGDSESTLTWGTFSDGDGDTEDN